MVATYEKSVQTGFREVADALARRGTMTQQLEAQASLRDAARVSYRLSEARFRAGVDPFLTTLDAQRTLYNAERSLLATRLSRAAKMVELYSAMGCGLQYLFGRTRREGTHAGMVHGAYLEQPPQNITKQN